MNVGIAMQSASEQPQRQVEFARRVNRDGNFDLICRTCRVIVATAYWHDDLGKAERDHSCDRQERKRYDFYHNETVQFLPNI